MGFVLVACACLCVCVCMYIYVTTPSPAGAKPFSFATARATGPGYLCKRQLTWGNPERAINSAACRRVVSLLMRWLVVEHRFSCRKNEISFCLLVPLYVRATLNSFFEFFFAVYKRERVYISSEKNGYGYILLRFLICGIGMNVRFIK